MVLSKQGLIGKDPDAGKDRRWEKGVTEDEMVGWHHWLDGHEFGWTPRVGDGQGGLACCSPWGHKESDSTGRLSWTDWNKGYLFRNTRVLANNIPFLLFSGKICIIQERIARCLWNYFLKTVLYSQFPVCHEKGENIFMAAGDNSLPQEMILSISQSFPRRPNFLSTFWK